MAPMGPMRTLTLKLGQLEKCALSMIVRYGHRHSSAAVWEETAWLFILCRNEENQQDLVAEFSVLAEERLSKNEGCAQTWCMLFSI